MAKDNLERSSEEEIGPEMKGHFLNRMSCKAPI